MPFFALVAFLHYGDRCYGVLSLDVFTLLPSIPLPATALTAVQTLLCFYCNSFLLWLTPRDTGIVPQSYINTALVEQKTSSGKNDSMAL